MSYPFETSGAPAPPFPASPGASLGASLMRAAFDAAAEGMLILAPDGTVLAANEAFCRLFGIDADQTVGRHHAVFTQRLDVRRWGEPIEGGQRMPERGLRGERVSGVLQRIRTPNGREFMARCGATPVVEAGRLAATILTVEDVTRGESAVAEVRAQNARYEAILAAERAVSSADGDDGALLQAAVEQARVLVRADGACVEIQEGDEMVYEAGVGLAERFVGLRLAASGSLSGRTVLEGVPNRCDDSETDPRVDRLACRKIGARSLALVPLRYDERSFGVLKTMSVRPEAFTDDDVRALGLLAGFLGAAIGRAKAARALRESEARFRAAVGAVGAMWTNSAEGRMEGEQPGWAALTGQTREDYEGYGWAKAVHPDDAGPTVDAWNAAVREARPFEFEHRVRTRNGAWRRFAIRALPVRGDDGAIHEWVGVHVDVTELREAVEALRRSEADLERRVEERTEALVRANRDLDQFAYSVAHDLRAPLRAIVSSSRILLDDLGDRLSDEERALLGRQSASGLRLARIVDDLLGFARLAQAEPRKTAFDLTELARAAAGHVEVARAGCDVRVQEGMRAVGDPNLVGYALTNLIDNACKFSPQGGAIDVGEADGAFFVRDQGVGFDMAHAGKLFVAFERLVGQEQFEGAGVGLANVKRIVEKHGGRVWAESQPGQGATFWFTLSKEVSPQGL